jgi:hypothetical protein
MRDNADRITERCQILQMEQFKRVSRMQADRIANLQFDLNLALDLPDENEPT